LGYKPGDTAGGLAGNRIKSFRRFISCLASAQIRSGILTWDYRQEALDLHGVFYESAHNEYLQYLVTMGPFTVAAYVLFLISSCVRMLRGYRKSPWILAPFMAVACYGVQAPPRTTKGLKIPRKHSMNPADDFKGLGLQAQLSKKTKHEQERVPGDKHIYHNQDRHTKTAGPSRPIWGLFLLLIKLRNSFLQEGSVLCACQSVKENMTASNDTMNL